MHTRVVILFVSLFALIFSDASRFSWAASLSSPPLVQIHWAGMTRITAGTNSADFLKIWQLPETAKLLDQTLGKLSRWPGGKITNASSKLLRPLLDDLVFSEFYSELHVSTNAEDLKFGTRNSKLFMIAVHLSDARASFWQTNLAAAFVALTGEKLLPMKSGWRLHSQKRYGEVEYDRYAEWSLLGVGNGVHEGLADFRTNLVRFSTASTSNVWLEADLDLSVFAFELQAGLSSNTECNSTGIEQDGLDMLAPLKELHFEVCGKSGGVYTHGTILLSQPLTNSLPAWAIPTNQIYHSVNAFTAVRGIAQWIAGLPTWQKSHLVPPPNQMFFWAQSGIPFQTYVAIPLPGASNQLSQLWLQYGRGVNLWLLKNGQGSMEWRGNLPGVAWNDAFMISPFLTKIDVDQTDYLLGGLFPLSMGDASPPPGEMFQPFADNPSLVFYQAEQTAVRVDAELFITQLFRMVFHKPQLPESSVVLKWLKEIEPFLQTSTTIVVLENPRQLSIKRQSTIGLNAMELHILADWLESPKFPFGFHTFAAKPD